MKLHLVVLLCGILFVQHAYGQAKSIKALINKMSGRCVSVTAASAANGATIVLWDCLNGPNQDWTFKGAPGMDALSYGALFPASAPDSAISVNGASMLDDSDQVQWQYVKAANQLWTVKQSLDPGYFRLVSKQNGKCLTTRARATINGTPLVTWGCVEDDGGSQRFQYIET